MKKITIMTIMLLNSFSVAKTEDPYDMSLENLLSYEVEIASNFLESTTKASSTVTMFSDVEISNMGLKTLDQLLGHVPGFVVSNLSDRISLSVRGSKSYAQVLLLIDGQKANEVIFGGFGLTSPEISLKNVKKVEVIRGPGSAIYGANAYLGVIKITTKNERFYSFEVGQNSMKEFTGSFTKKIGKTKLSMFSQFYQDEDYKYKSYPQSASSGDGTVITNKTLPNGEDSKERVDLQLKIERGQFHLNLSHMQRKYSGGTSADALVLSKHQNISKPMKTLVHTGYNFRISEKEDLKINLGYTVSRFSPFGIRGTKNGFENFSGGEQIENRYRLTGDYRNAKNRVKIASGFEVYNEGLIKDKVLSNFDSDGNHKGSIVDNGAAYKGPRIKQYGFYVQGQTNLAKDLDTTFGVRIDDNSIFGSAISPRLSIIKSFLSRSVLKLQYGEAFRGPTYSEFFQNTFIQGNSSLKPEKVRTFETAISQDFANTRLQLTYFLSQFENQIEGYLNGSNITFRNMPNSKREGLEFEFTSILTKDLSVKGNYSYVFKINKTDQIAPDPFVNGAVILNWNKENFTFNVSTKYHRSYDGVDQSSLFLVNSKIGYSIDDVNYYLSASNLGNKEFLNSTFVRTNHQVNRGRIISGGMEMKY